MPLSAKTNPGLVALIQDLRKKSWEQEAPIWRDIAERLSKPTKQHREVNLSRIDRYADKGETVLVPGKLLGAGAITKPVTIAAYAISEAARAKVVAAGGKCLSIRELADSNPKGKKVRILG